MPTWTCPGSPPAAHHGARACRAPQQALAPAFPKSFVVCYRPCSAVTSLLGGVPPPAHRNLLARSMTMIPRTKTQAQHQARNASRTLSIHGPGTTTTRTNGAVAPPLSSHSRKKPAWARQARGRRVSARPPRPRLPPPRRRLRPRTRWPQGLAATNNKHLDKRLRSMLRSRKR